MNRATLKARGGSSSTRLESRRNLNLNKPQPRSAIRVLLADDHPVVRWGLTCCLAPHKRLQVVGEAADGLEALRKARELKPDVILMDIEMPQMSGLAATEILRRERPEVNVLLLSMHPYTGQISRILQSGARGFLLKDTRPADIVAALCKVAAGETCFSPVVARHVLQQFSDARGQPQSQLLTEREREVLIGIAEGLTNKEIAERLGISSRTIETHRTHIARKLNIRSIAGLTRFAISQGLADVPKSKS